MDSPVLLVAIVAVLFLMSRSSSSAADASGDPAQPIEPVRGQPALTSAIGTRDEPAPAQAARTLALASYNGGRSGSGLPNTQQVAQIVASPLRAAAGVVSNLRDGNVIGAVKVASTAPIAAARDAMRAAAVTGRVTAAVPLTAAAQATSGVARFTTGALNKVTDIGPAPVRVATRVALAPARASLAVATKTTSAVASAGKSVVNKISSWL